MTHRRTHSTKTNLYGSKEVKRLLSAVVTHNPDVRITRTGGGHARVKAEGLPPVIVSSGKGDHFGHVNAVRELRKAGYKV